MPIQNINSLGGANTNLSPFLQPDNSPPVLNGVVVHYKLGAVLKDVGYKKVGGTIQSGKNVLGLFDFKQPGGTQVMLSTCDDASSDDTQLFRKTDAGSWTEITAAETAWANSAGITTSMESFINYTFFVGYGTADGFLPVGTLIDSTFSTSVNCTDMAQGKQILRYRDRLYVINCRYSGTNYPYRIYLSSVPTGGAITWTPASDFLDVDYSEQLTGAGAHWDKMVFFTEDNAYMYDQTIFKKVWATGCSNWRTIKNSGQYMLWANGDGVWMSSGGQPLNIGGPVIDFFRNSTPTDYFAAVVDEEYHLYVGDVTVNGIDYTNVKLTFNIPTSTWRWRELGHTMTSLAKKSASGVSKLYMGGSGLVWEKGKHSDSTILKADDGLSIKASVEFPPIYLKNLSLEKASNTLTVFAEKAQGVKLYWRVIDSNSRVLTKFKPLGQLTKYINSFDVDIKGGVLLQISLSDDSTNEYFSILGYELDAELYSEILKQ